MITAVEVFYLLIMTQSIMVHVVILPLAYHAASRDAWISAILSIPVGMIFIWVIYRLRLSFSSGFDDYITKTAGKITLIVLKVIFSLYFLFLASFSVASLLDMVKVAFLTLTPLWALAVCFMIGCLYLAVKGYKIIAMVAGVLIYFSVISGIFIAIFDSFEKKLANILPLLESGWQPLGSGMIVLSSIWVEMIFLLFVPIDPSKNKHKGIARACYWGVLVNGITMVLTLAGTVMVFGLGQTENLNFPSLEIVRFLSLGFVDRFDVYGEVLMIFGTLIRSSLYLRIAFDQVFKAPRPIAFWIEMLCAGAAVTALAIFMCRTHFALKEFLSYYTYGIYLFPIPFLIYGLGLLRKKKALGKS